MLERKSQTAAFSGYRHDKLRVSIDNSDALHTLKLSIAKSLEELYNKGIRRFITGGAIGFDTMAAIEIVELRNTHSDVEHIIAAPFAGQELRYSPKDQIKYHDNIASADIVHYISKEYHKSAYHERNRYMLQNASILVCYYDGQSGGTMYTVNHALNLGLEIINLCESYQIKESDMQLSLPFDLSSDSLSTNPDRD